MGNIFKKKKYPSNNNFLFYDNINEELIKKDEHLRNILKQVDDIKINHTNLIGNLSKENINLKNELDKTLIKNQELQKKINIINFNINNINERLVEMESKEQFNSFG